jgi:nucleotide-binding universal stress UspA family protein
VRGPTVLVGYVKGGEGADALALGWILGTLLHARILVTNVARTTTFARGDGTEPLTMVAASYEDVMPAMERAAAEAPSESETPTGDGAEIETRVVASRSAARGLHDLAEDEDAELVVLGSSVAHRAPATGLLGSVALRLLHGSACAVAVAPSGYAGRTQGRLGSVAVAIDESLEAVRALAAAASLAQTAGADLTVFTVVEPLSPSIGRWTPLGGVGAGQEITEYGATLERQWAAAEQLVAGAVNSLSSELNVTGQVLSGDPAERIASETGGRFDLLVMGSRGYGAVGRVLLGSTSAAVLRRASCPVLIEPPAPAGGDG